MLKMNKNEELIYRSAFRLFLQKGYHDVSVKDLEEATGLSRGAVFYYQRDKRTLYKKVLELYFLSQQSVSQKLCGFEDCETLEDFLGFYISRIEQSMASMYGDAGEESILQSYLLLSLEAHKYIPDFNERMEALFAEERKVWRIMINRAKSIGEISPQLDTDVVITMFRTAFLGLVFETSFSEDLSIVQLKNLFASLYHLVKS